MIHDAETENGRDDYQPPNPAPARLAPGLRKTYGGAAWAASGHLTERGTHIDHLHESDITIIKLETGPETYGGHHGVEIVCVVVVGGSRLRNREEAVLPSSEIAGHLLERCLRASVEEAGSRNRIHSEGPLVDKPGEFLRRSRCTAGWRMVEEDSSSRSWRAARSGRRGSNGGRGMP